MEQGLIDPVKIYKDMVINDLVGLAYEKEVFGFRVLVVNCPEFFSQDLQLILCKNRPFSVTWFYDGREKIFSFSLRSDEQEMDLTPIAQKVGAKEDRNYISFKLKPEDVDNLLDLE